MISRRQIIEKYGYGSSISTQTLGTEKPLPKKIMKPFCTSQTCAKHKYACSYKYKDLPNKPDWCPDCGDALVYLETFIDEKGQIRGFRPGAQNKTGLVTQFARDND